MLIRPLAVLFMPLALLLATWVAREPPASDGSCGAAGPPEVRDAWLAGLAPEAFVAGCFCAAVVLWCSVVIRAGAPGVPTITGVALALAAGVAWWAGWEAGLWWGLLAYVGLIPSVLVVPGFAAAVLMVRAALAWHLLRVLAWWCGLVLVPGFVAVIATWGEDLCMS